MQYLTQASHVPGIVCYRHLILTDVSGIIVVVVQSLSCVRLFVTPWTAASQAGCKQDFSVLHYLWEFAQTRVH